MARLSRSGTSRLALRFFLLLAGGMITGEAVAQPSPGKAVDSLACRRQCGAHSPDRTQNPPSVQSCLMRCSAGERYMIRQHQRGTPEATGRGTAPRGASPALSTGTPAAPPLPGAAPGSRTLAAYVATPPGRGIAISPPVERMAAHRGAETECSRQNNSNPCRLLTETQEHCLAVSEAIRATGLVVTANPSTYMIHYHGTGMGPDQASAEEAALRDCQGRRAPGVICRIAATRCAG